MAEALYKAVLKPDAKKASAAQRGVGAHTRQLAPQSHTT